MKRRDFLISSGGVAATFLTARTIPGFVFERNLEAGQKSKLNNYLVAGYCDPTNFPVEDSILGISKDTDGFACTMDLETSEIKRFSTPIFAHSYNQHPVHLNQAVGVAKWTPTAIAIHLRTGEVLAKFKAPETYRFFGHAVFNSDGSLVFLTADSLELQKGGICVFDSKSAKLVKIIPTACRIPHELILSLDGEIIVAGRLLKNQTISGLMEYYDPFRLRPIRHHPLPGTELVAHLAQLNSRTLMILGGATGTRPEVYLFDLTSKEIKDIRSAEGYPKEEMLGEALSVAKISDSEVGVTFSPAKKLVIWNHRTNSVRVLPFKKRTFGLVAHAGTLLLSTGKGGTIHTFHDLGQNGITEFSVSRVREFANGSHLRLMSF